MSNKPDSKKKQFEFILTFEPEQKLSEEQVAGLFKNGIEKIPRTNLYTRKGTNWLSLFLCLDTLEHESSFLGLSQLEYRLVKKEVR